MVELVAARELSPYYYRDNFLALCDTVQARYDDLLKPTERQMLASFRALDHASQCLYVRLVSRVGPMFRVGKLEYPEIGVLEVPLNTLMAQELACPVQAITVAEMSRVYTRSELLSVFGGQFEVPAASRKEVVLEAIDALDLLPEDYMSCLRGAFDSDLVVIRGGSEVALMQLLFFGNCHQSLTDFILSDLGLATYYPYELDRELRLFPERAAVEEYLVCRQFSEEFQELVELQDTPGILALARQMLAMENIYASSARRWQRTCTRVARELERLRELDLALCLYARCHVHPARERSARIFESKNLWPEVLGLCAQIKRGPWCEAELEAANRIEKRVQRKAGAKKLSRLRDRFEELNLLVAPQSGSVERDAATRLSTDWESVHFVENSLMNSLFGLAFWEQIFAAVPGAFHNRFQSVPTDMYAGNFAANRAREIAERLEELRTANLREELGRRRQNVENYQCRWTDWYRVSAELQDTALSIIPREHLLSIWERQLFDPRENRSGLPDLIAFGEEYGDYCMIEVKGPGDKLQDNQKRWLRYFQEHGIPAQVAWVEWADAAT